MTDSDERRETWKPVAPMDGCTFSGYEASDKGRYQSVDRKQGNRQLKGKVLATRRTDDGYVLVNIRCDSTDPDHNRVHTFSGHTVVLTTFDRPRPDGMEACHSPRGKTFNWWPEGVRWDTRPANIADMAEEGLGANGRPFRAPKPPAAPCIRCGGPVTSGGRRCHECVVAIGQEAAGMLRAGVTLEDANERLGYANAVYLHVLAVKYGGWGTCPVCSQSATNPPPVTFRERLSRALTRAFGHGA
jgi:hypothetical protein